MRDRSMVEAYQLSRNTQQFLRKWVGGGNCNWLGVFVNCHVVRRVSSGRPVSFRLIFRKELLSTFSYKCTISVCMYDGFVCLSRSTRRRVRGAMTSCQCHFHFTFSYFLCSLFTKEGHQVVWVKPNLSGSYMTVDGFDLSVVITSVHHVHLWGVFLSTLA